MFNSLKPHGLQRIRLLCPLPRVCSDSWPLSQWCYIAILSSVIPFSCLQSFQCVSSLHQVAKVLELQHHSFQWIFKVGLGLTGLISLQSRVLSSVFSSTKIWKHQFFSAHPSSWSNFHIRIQLLETQQLWLYRSLSAKMMSLFFNTLSSVVIAFLQKQAS